MIDGETFEEPYDLDFSKLTVDEVVKAVGRGARDPAQTTTAFLFANLQARIPQLTDDYWASFRDQIVPMFSGDPSMVEVVGG